MKTAQRGLTRLVFFLACGGILAQVDVASGEIVAPGFGHTNYNAIPFNSLTGMTRYQQIYDDSIFSGITGPQFSIEQLAFSAQNRNTTIPYSANIEIRLTTTSVAPNSISSVLDNNFTEPLTTVFSNAAFSQSIDVNGTDSWGLVFSLTTPFLYTPSDGTNLLMDILITSGTQNSFSFNNSTALTGSAKSGGNFNADSNGGLRTQFTGTSVPEPSTLLLLGMGGVGLIALARRRMRMAV